MNLEKDIPKKFLRQTFSLKQNKVQDIPRQHYERYSEKFKQDAKKSMIIKSIMQCQNNIHEQHHENDQNNVIDEQQIQNLRKKSCPIQIIQKQRFEIFKRELQEQIKHDESQEEQIDYDKQIYKVLNVHSNSICSMSYSPDGNNIVSVSRDGCIRQTNVKTEVSQIINKLSHTIEANNIQFSRDGDFISYLVNENTMIVQQSSDYKIVHKHISYNKKIIYAAFSPDGQKIATATNEGTIQINNINNPNSEITLMTNKKDIFSMCFSEDGLKLATCSEDKQAIVWNTEQGEIEQIFQKHTQPINSIKFSQDGSQLATAGRDCIAIIWDTQEAEVLKTLVYHHSQILNICYSSCNYFVATSSDDDVAIIWSLITGQVWRQYNLAETGVIFVQFEPFGQQLATISRDHNIIILNAKQNGQTEFDQIIQQFQQDSFKLDKVSIKTLKASGVFGLNILQYSLIKKDFDQIKDLLKRLTEFQVFMHICNLQYEDQIIECVDKSYIKQFIQYYICQQEKICNNCQLTLQKILKDQQTLTNDHFDLFLNFQFAIKIIDQVIVKQILDQLLELQVSIHLCQFEYFNQILNCFNEINNENQRKFIDLIITFNQQHIFCKECIEPQNKLIEYFCKSKLDLKKLLDSSYITEDADHLAFISENQEFYIKQKTYGLESTKYKFDKILKTSNRIIGKNTFFKRLKQFISGTIGINPYYLKHQKKLKQQSCYFHFLRIQQPIFMVNLIQLNYKSSDCEIYQSVALRHLIDQQYEDYGKYDYLKEAGVNILGTLFFIFNIFMFQSEKNNLFFYGNPVPLQTKIVSTLMDIICMCFSLILAYREYLEYGYKKMDGKSYFHDGWNYFDLLGISSQFGSCLTDLLATYGIYNDDIKHLNCIFSMIGIFFQTIACIKYFRILNKFSSLIQLLQKVVYDMRYFSSLLAAITMDFYLIFYIFQAYHFDGIQYTRFQVFRMTYLILFGSFDPYLTITLPNQRQGAGVSYLIFGIFAIAAFLLQVVLMNLLISIIGDTYGKVQEQIYQDQLFERINIISRINRKLNKKDDGQFLIVVSTQQTLKNDEDDIKELKTQIDEFKQDIHQLIDEQNEKIIQSIHKNQTEKNSNHDIKEITDHSIQSSLSCQDLKDFKKQQDQFILNQENNNKSFRDSPQQIEQNKQNPPKLFINKSQNQSQDKFNQKNQDNQIKQKNILNNDNQQQQIQKQQVEDESNQCDQIIDLIKNLQSNFEQKLDNFYTQIDQFNSLLIDSDIKNQEMNQELRDDLQQELEKYQNTNL